MTEDEAVDFPDVINDLLASEADIRQLQHRHGYLDRELKPGRRTDLMPGRHLAIALTAIEEARLRIGEAHRLVQSATEE